MPFLENEMNHKVTIFNLYRLFQNFNNRIVKKV